MWEIKHLDSFAIKYRFVDMVRTNEDMFPLGYFCFSIDDNIVGEPEELVYFKLVYYAIHDFTKEYKNKQRFVNKEFYNSPEAVIFYTLYEQFFPACYENYSAEEQKHLLYIKPINENQSISYETAQDVFHLDFVGEDTFLDRFGLILINCEDKQKLIIKDFRQDTFICQEYDIGTIDKLLCEFACVISIAPSDLHSDGS